MSKKDLELKFKFNCSGKIFRIKQCDLPYTACQPGVYVLESNLYWDRTDIAAITVTSPSVTIDLNLFTIDLKNMGTRAIFAAGVTQLYILNGNIKNGAKSPVETAIIPPFTPSFTFPDITAAVIRLDSCSNVRLMDLNIDNVLYGIVGTNMIDDVVVYNVEVFHFGIITTINNLVQPVGGGLILSGASLTNNLVDVTILECKIQSQTGYNSILLNYTTGFTISGCENTAGRVSVTGQTLGCYTFTNSSSGVIKNSTARYCTQPIFALRVTGVDVINNQIWDTNHNGMEFVFSNNCTYQNNTIHQSLDAPSVGFLGSGIKVTVGNYFIVTGNKVTGFTFGTDPTDSNGAGISIGASNFCTIQGNQVNGNNFGIKEILTEAVGPPPPFTGTPSTYVQNVAVGNIINNYIGIPASLISPPSPTAGAWVNISN